MPKRRLPPVNFSDMDDEALHAYLASLNDYIDDDTSNDGEEVRTVSQTLAEYATPPDAVIVDHPQSASKRGSIGAQWWGKQWVAALLALQGEGRLDRGRTYARRGNVQRMEISRGMAYAKVQGSRPRPYSSAVELKTFSDAEWQKAMHALGSQALYAAKLLAGEMPADIEGVFNEVKLSLFPRDLKDITFDCSCPDWGSPCKHAAAVYYLLAEQIDKDPFVLLHLRGRTRDQVLAALRALRSTGELPAVTSDDALDSDLGNFWGSVALPTLEAPSKPHTPYVFQRFGDPPADVVSDLKTLYARIIDRSYDLLNPPDADGEANGDTV